MERQVFLHIFYKRDQGPGICRPLRYIKPCNVFFQCFNRFLDLAFSFSNPMDKHDPFFLVDLVESFPSLRLMSFQSRSLQKSSAFFFCFATDWGNKNSFWHRACHRVGLFLVRHPLLSVLFN